MRHQDLNTGFVALDAPMQKARGDARSLSMSDVVEIIEDHGSSFHICDTFGFKEVDFDTSKVLEGST